MERKEQKFQIIKNTPAKVHPLVHASLSYWDAFTLAHSINEKIFPRGESFMEVVAMDEGQTPTIDELWPMEIVSEVDFLYGEMMLNDIHAHIAEMKREREVN